MFLIAFPLFLYNAIVANAITILCNSMIGLGLLDSTPNVPYVLSSARPSFEKVD